MAIFISDPSTALGPDISTREPARSFHNILGTRKRFKKLPNYDVIPITECPGKQ